MLQIQPFEWQHCETTATGTILLSLGIALSEPMLFGLGKGLSYIFWNMKDMDRPFIGGRIKPDLITQNIAQSLKLDLFTHETSSPKKAWENVKNLIDEWYIVGLKLDCYHLEYFSHPIHFAWHYVAMYGYDADSAYLVDTKQQGWTVKTSLRSLALARAETWPMASKNMYYFLKKTGHEFDMKDAILTAIRDNAAEYLNPPITNISYKGILKTSTEIIKWFKQTQNVTEDFSTTAMLMERAGTGGALFRNLYRDFLKESHELIGWEKLRLGYEAFVQIALLWMEVARLFEEASGTKDIAFIYQASEVLKEIAEKERWVMEMLVGV